MRKDVKLGLVLSLVLVVLAGWYFVGRGEQEKPVPMTGKEAPGQTVVADAGAKPSPAIKDRAPHRTPRRPGSASAKSADTAVKRAAPSRRAKPVPAPRERSGLAAATPDRSTPSPVKPKTSPGESGRRLTLSEVLAHRSDEGDTSEPADASAAGAETVRGPGATAETELSPKPVVPGTTPGKAPAKQVRPATEPPRATRAPGTRYHVIEKGDTLAILAELYYGSQQHADFLLRANPHVKSPSRLMVGTRLAIPPLGSRPMPAGSTATVRQRPTAVAQARDVSATAKKKADVPPAAKPAPTADSYTVKPGDSFYKIAERVLGKASRWPEIFELNKEAVHGKPERLRVGQVIKLPPKSKPKSD